VFVWIVNHELYRRTDNETQIDIVVHIIIHYFAIVTLLVC